MIVWPGAQRDGCLVAEVGDEADAADGGGRRNGHAIGLVVERDIARDDGEGQRPARLGHALDAADEFAHDLRSLGIAEIQAVGDGERLGAGGGEIAPGFRDRLLAALERVGMAIARGHVAGRGKPLIGAVDAHHGRIAARALHGVRHDHVVILLPDPAAGGKMRRAHQRHERVGRGIHRRNVFGADAARAAWSAGNRRL